MPDSCSVLWLSAAPTFTTIGDHLEVRLVSGTKNYAFRMPVAIAQVAMCRCDQAIAEGMRPKPSNVRKLRRRPSPRHV